MKKLRLLEAIFPEFLWKDSDQHHLQLAVVDVLSTFESVALPFLDVSAEIIKPVA